MNNYENNNSNRQDEHKVNWPLLILGLAIFIGGIIVVVAFV